MKNIKIYSTLMLLLAMSIFSSCEDQLEIISEDDVSPQTALSNVKTITGVVLGIYSQAQSQYAFNGSPQLSGEYQADNSTWKGSFPTLRAIYDYTTREDNRDVNTIWVENNDVIEASNFVINNLPEVDVPNLNDNLKNQFIGEAKFMRALTMFNMSLYFGQPYQVANGESLSIPIILEDFKGDIEPFLAPRNTLNQVYSQIETDLKYAIENLPSSYSNNDDTRGRATSGAAMALLARMELYRENYATAAELADNVIKAPEYKLAPDYGFYDGLTAEDVFTIINLAIDNQGSMGYSNLTNPTPEARGDVPFSDNLVEAYQAEAGDLRFTTLTQVGIDAEGVSSVFTTKYNDGATNSDNAPIIRITEMYLIRAEANLKGSTTIGDTPVNDINLLRKRAGLAALATVNNEDILRERRKELAFEGGHRRIDLLRNGMSLRRTGQPNVAESVSGGPLTIFPIPSLELGLNPNLEKNPGY